MRKLVAFAVVLTDRIVFSAVLDDLFALASLAVVEVTICHTSIFVESTQFQLFAATLQTFMTKTAWQSRC